MRFSWSRETVPQRMPHVRTVGLAKLVEILEKVWILLAERVGPPYPWHTMIYQFAEFELDLDAVELRVNGVARSIEPQVFALLAFLIENRGRLVRKEQILEKIWDGRIVSDAALSSRIKSARQALQDDGTTQRFIQTAHRQGFRFVADVKVLGGRRATADVELVDAVDATDTAVCASAPSQVGARPSIAILPFRLVGALDDRFAALASAIPDELIVELARFRSLVVTARGSSFRLSPTESEFSDIGKLLNVRYCLTGTVELIAARIGVTVKLVDTEDSSIVWANEFVRPIDDVHALREELRSQVIAALEIRVSVHEASRAQLRAIEDLDAWSAFHLGLQHIYRFNRLDNTQAVRLFDRAVALDPSFARAHAGLSFVHFQTAFMHYSDDIDVQIDLARRCAERAVEIDPLDPFTNFTLGRTYWLKGELGTGLEWLGRATQLSPNYAQGLYAQAFTEAMSGEWPAGRAHTDYAMRLSPLDPLYYAMLGTRAWSHVMESDDAKAAHWAERAARAPGAHVLIAMIAAAAHALNGNSVRANAWAANARERNDSLNREIFFRAFPLQVESTRARVSKALAELGF